MKNKQRIKAIREIGEIPGNRISKVKKRIEELEKENTELKAERLQWHYLAETPNDLPKKEGPYWVCVRDGRYKEDGSWEWTSKPLCMVGVWRDGIFGTAGGPPVIAWCELPTFDKEIGK